MANQLNQVEIAERAYEFLCKLQCIPARDYVAIQELKDDVHEYLLEIGR